MKKSVIGICISLLCVGSGIYANQQNNDSSPVVSTVTNSTKKSKVIGSLDAKLIFSIKK